MPTTRRHDRRAGGTARVTMPVPIESPTAPAAATQPEPHLQQPYPLLIEVAWEVCAQVGGIYTVLRSKAPTAVRRWGDNYWLVGPWHEAAARIELEPQPATGVVGEALDELALTGIRSHTGRWLVTGRPQVILFDLRHLAMSLADMKYYFWKDIHIDSPAGDCEHDDVVKFGYIAADFLQRLHSKLGPRPLLAHFHEWQASAALPILRQRDVALASVFTTHATLVGRSLSSANEDWYTHLSSINGGAVATAHGFHHRHAVECAAAHSADVFTTVSEVTAREAGQFLGRRPEFLVPNGLNVERLAAPHEFQVMHQRAKERIHEFVIGHFFPSYTFDLDRTLFVFTAGRYEYRNKGIDVFIESLHRLNQRLKADRSTVTVIAFIITRAPYRAPNVETLNRHAMLHEVRDTCEDIQDGMGRRLFRAVAEGRLPAIDELLDEYASVRLKRLTHRWRQGPLPTIVTHDLLDDANDPVLRHLRFRGLLNSPHDPVKVIFHPEFVSLESPILSMDYDQFVRGCHLGVFPSYYEPWGYTPMECVVRGVPSITSDLAGFGTYVMQNFPDHDSCGVMVARRRDVPIDVTIDMTTDWMHALTRMSRRDRIRLRNRVESLADQFDWSNLIRFYREARQQAFTRRYPDWSSFPPEPTLDSARITDRFAG